MRDESCLTGHSNVSRSAAISGSRTRNSSPTIIPIFLIPFRVFFLILPKHTIKHPVYRGSRNASAGTGIDALQMLYHISDDRQLNIRWICNGDALSALASYQLDRLIGKDRERERTLVANHLNTVFLGTLMAHEAPTAARRNTTFEEETGRYRIFCIIKMRTVGRITMGTGDDSKEILQ